jgi:hypothetical protein
MKDLKSKTVLFLTRDDASDLDRSAAKLLAQCDVEPRHVNTEESSEPSIDVLLHGHPDTIDAIKTEPNAAGRIENALREASDASVRHLQWVEESRTSGPRNGSGIGVDTDAVGGARKAGPGEPPDYHNAFPDDLKRDKPHEQRPPGTTH